MKLNQLSLKLTLLLVGIFPTMLIAQQKTATDTIKTDSVKIKQLNEVLVKSTKKMIEHKVDRTIVNLAGQVTLQGLDAYELLERMPGVRVTGDGMINLLGKGATIYVDGKPTYLSGNDLAAYLRTLPAAQLAKIELMPNPPAKYDAAGSGGIINIFTKKDRQPGYNAGASLNAGSGQYRKINGSINFNYRVNKLNFFLNAGAGSPKDFEKLTGTRFFTDDQHNILSILEQQSRSEFTRENRNLKLGTDYYVSKRTTFGFIINLNRNQTKEYGLNTNVMYNAQLPTGFFRIGFKPYR
jgi:iron complex outermembrane receptor protein